MAVSSHNKEQKDKSDRKQPASMVNGTHEYSYEDDIEYWQLNDALDEINNFMDSIMEKSKALNRELVNLLESNRQNRREFQKAAA